MTPLLFKSFKLKALILLLMCGLSIKAQKYWVGGSGNWNDTANWAIESGGNGGAKLPQLNETVIFDQNAADEAFVVSLSGKISLKSFVFGNHPAIEFKSDQNTTLYILNDFNFPANVTNNIKGAAKLYNQNNHKKLVNIEQGAFKGLKSPPLSLDKEIQTLAIDSIDVEVNNLTCHNSSDGAIEITIFGGGGPFTFNWFPNDPPLDGEGTNRVFNLDAGLYSVVITDESDGSAFVETDIQVTAPSPVTVQRQNTTNVSCFNGNDGGINTFVFGGQAPYVFSWDDANNQSTQNAANLSAGTYQLTVTDDNNCVATGSNWVVTEPPVLELSISDFTNLTCFEVCSGDATAEATGGTPDYTYNWYDLNNEDTTFVEGLCAQEYNVEVTDANGCKDTANVSLTEPTPIVTTIDITQVSCNGFDDASASANVSGGNDPYTFSWYDVPGSPTLSSVNDLAPGTYHLEVTDDNGCKDTTEFEITEPDVLEASIVDSVNILCYGLCTGEAEVGAIGGTGAYTFTWLINGSPNTNRITDQCADTIFVQVEDENACLDTTSVRITQPEDSISIDLVDTIHNLCFEDCFGEIEVLASGGTGSLNYLWYDAPGNPTSARIDELCANTYNVEVTDDNACKDTLAVEITEPSEIQNNLNISNIACGGDCDGEASVQISGGIAPYTYDWYDVPGGSTDSAVSDLCAGTYHVEVRDANDCKDTIEVVITEPDTLEIVIDNKTDVLCKNECNGAAETQVTGGVGPFAYLWYDVPGTPTGQNITNLCAGTYNVEVTDDNACKDSVEVEITEPALELSTLMIDSVMNSCFGDCEGEAEVQANGGTGAYTYNWYDADNQNTARATELCVGDYNVEVSDENGCADTASVSITQPDSALQVSIVDSLDLVCFEVCEGRAVVDYEGGTGPYNIDWYNAGNQNTDTIKDLCADTYFVAVSDQNGCADTASVSIEQPAILATDITSSIMPSCKGDCDGTMEVNPSGGTAPYDILWWDVAGSPTTNQVTDQCAGNYNVVVTDDNGCQDSTEVVLSDPDSLVFSIDNQVDVLCKNECTGEATVTASGGVPGYTVTWLNSNNQSVNLTETDLCAGITEYQIEDDNGCIDTGTVEITEPDFELEVSIVDSVGNLCFGACEGEAEAAGNGGVGSYAYNWFDASGETTTRIDELCNGTYNVEITDDNACKDTASIEISSPDSLSTDLSIENLSCNAQNDGTAKANVSGGTAPYTYLWYDVPGTPTTDSVSDLAAGTYHLEVSDANDCKDTVEFEIIEPTDVVAEITDSANITCFDACNGTITVAATGGFGNYSYTWYDAPGTPDTNFITELCPGTYHVAVLDESGCADTVSATLTQPNEIIVTTDSTPATCNGICDASAWIEVSGGVAPYTYNWYDVPGAPSTDSVVDLCTGEVNVEITDDNGCLDTVTIDITAPDVVVANIADSSNNLCATACEGSARVEVNGGVYPYSYDWQVVNGVNTDSIVSDLCNGTYEVTVSDDNGCQDVQQVTIESPDSLIVKADVIEPSCNGDDNGSIKLNITGGVEPYTINWYELGGLTTDSLTDVDAGTYNVEVTDDNGCVDTLTIEVDEPAVLSATMIDSLDVLCFGNETGLAEVEANGGTTPYTYDWFDAPGTPNTARIENLPAGIYNVAVTDTNSCSDTASVEITQADSLILTMDSTQVTCVGICDGSASVEVQGGQAPYAYSWYNAPGSPTTDSIVDLCVGTYFVEITDDNGCVDTNSIEVSAPITVVAQISDSTNLLCRTVCDGEATVSASGGTEVYTYNWFDVPGGGSDSTIENLCFGTYNVEVADENGCVDSATVNIEGPDSLSVSNNNIMPNCNGDDNGSIKIEASGGVAPYDINWFELGGLTTDSITDLEAGTYNVEITDANLCKDTFAIELEEPDSLIANVVDAQNISCYDGSDGFIKVDATGGVTPYTFLWYDAPGTPTTDSIGGLSAGDYNVEITDDNGCVDSILHTLTQPDSILLTTDSNPVSCVGVCDGTAKVSVNGGVAPYTYLWYDAPGSPTTDSIGDLCAGIYHVEVSDDNGCVDTAVVEVTAPDALSLNISDSTNLICRTVCDGEATVSASGGIAPYTYNWYDSPNNGTDSSENNLCFGTYNVEVTDDNGCLDTISVSIDAPDSITIQSNLYEPSCNGASDGAIKVSASGGLGDNYQYNWLDLGSNADSVFNIAADTFALEVTDSAGCTQLFEIVLGQPDSLIARIVDTVNVACFGSEIGEAEAGATGGTAPYTYLWYDIPGAPTTARVEDLGVGIYHVEVSDANGCVDTTAIEIDESDSVQIDSSTVITSCYGVCDGEAFVEVSNGGTAPYQINWLSNGTVVNDTLTNACPGKNFVEITDAENCVDTFSVSVPQPDSLVALIDTMIRTSCPDGNDGIAVANATGGTGPYTYQWNDGLNQNTDTATNLSVQTYEVVVTDANGCMDTTTIDVLDPDNILANDSLVMPLCKNDCNGEIFTNTSGGSAPYTYLWNTGETTANIADLCADTFKVNITDANNCVDSFDIVLGEPDSLIASTSGNDLLCNGDSSGLVIASASGGVGPYTFEWNDALNTLNDSLENIPAGTYIVTARDSNACEASDTVSIGEPDSLTAFISDTLMANCLCNGEATVRANGGTEPYTYEWDDINNQTDSTANNLCATNYTVIVTDNNACETKANVTIEDTSTFQINIVEAIDALCNGSCDGSATVRADSGALPYSYQWNDPNNQTDSTASNLCAGTYFVQVQDAEGCVRIESVTIEEPDALQNSSDFIAPLCYGDSNALAWVNVNGGTAPYTHSWSNGVTTDSIFDVPAGTYADTITDANGCKDTVVINITQPDSLELNLAFDSVSCNGLSDASIWSGVQGGTAPYTYSWSDPMNSTSDTVQNLSAGKYILELNDTNNCFITDSVDVLEPNELIASINDTAFVDCFCTGSSGANVSGGNGNFSYQWDDANNQTDSLATNLCAGNYTVLVSDFKGCSDTAALIVQDTSGFQTEITATTDLSCFEACDGTAITSATGGNAPYTFQYSDANNTTDSIVNDLCAGNYTVQITDDIGCTQFRNFEITQPDSLELDFNAQNNLCFESCDGFIKANVNGGTTPYTYQWNDAANSTTDSIANLCVGTYTLVLTDSLNCTITDAVTITQPDSLYVVLDSIQEIVCHNDNNGLLKVEAVGGTAPYDFVWDNAADSNFIDNLSAGDYTLTLNDQNNCNLDSTFTLDNPDELITELVDSAMVDCFGDSTGYAVIAVSGGVAPYTYNWLNTPVSNSDSVATNLPAGDYTVVVKDASNCLDSLTVSITQANQALTIDDLSLTTTGCITCNGSAEATIVGGTAPYDYEWVGVAGNINNKEVTGLCAGQYELIVTDTNGCSMDSLFNISASNGLTVSITDTAMNSCFESCDGSISVAPRGGTLPYTFNWDNSTVDDSVLTDICANDYNLTLIDGDGCRAFVGAEITQPDELIATIIDTSNTACTAPCSGEATVDVVGGVGNYTYNWPFAGQNTPTATGLCAGQYVVEIQDETGCSVEDTATIYGPNGYTVLLDSVKEVSCAGLCDGYAEISVINVDDNYNVSWNGGNTSTDTIVDDLCARDYIATVVNGDGCEAFAFVQIESPDTIGAKIVASNGADCFDEDGGWAVVGYDAGVEPVSILWDDPLAQTTDTVQNLSAGDYQVMLTDAFGCMDSASVSIAQGFEIFVEVTDSSDASCEGVCDGSATVDVSGGVGNYTFQWESGGNAQNPSDLCAGTQVFQVSDSVGCTVTDSVIIDHIEVVNLDFEVTNVSCNGDCDGEIKASAIGGTAPYSHAWSNGLSDSTISNLCAGMYTDTLRDAIGCIVVDSVEVTQSNELLVTVIDSQAVSCFGNCDGSAGVSVDGGSYPYSYSWSNGNTSDSIVNNLCADEYIVEVRDNNNCLSTDTIVIDSPNEITIDITKEIAPLCYDSCNGEIVVNASGGFGNYTYAWDNDLSGDSIVDLCADDYTLTVSDDSSCSNTFNITLDQPDSLEIEVINLVEPTCLSNQNGAIEIKGNGGTAPYNYQWSAPVNVNDSIINNLDTGNYEVVVNDANNCSQNFNVYLSDSNALAIALQASDVSCNGDCDGSVTSVVSGGVGNYTYNWDNGSVNNDISSLCAATYTLTVSDEDNCVEMLSAVVNEPDLLSASINDVSNPDCFGDCDGTIISEVNGGVQPYRFEWDDALQQTDSIANNLCAGAYELTVLDSNNCSTTVTANITQPDGMETTLSFNRATCTYSFDASAEASVSGGAGNYVYTWFNNEGFNASGSAVEDLTTGWYFVTVEDANQCAVTDSVLIDEEYFVLADAGSDFEICEGEDAQLNGSGGMSYQWSTGESAQQIIVQPQETEEYILTAINNTCEDKDTVVITVLPNPVASITAENDFLLEGTEMELLGSGADAGGTYNWNPPVNISDPTSARPTVTPEESIRYHLTVNNTSGCEDSTSILINVAESIIIPDGLSPNNDGINDEWKILLIEEFPQAIVEVYNRWGQLVFRSEGYTERWDGTHNGKELPVGTYYYIINLGPDLPQYDGPVTIMR